MLTATRNLTADRARFDARGDWTDDLIDEHLRSYARTDPARRAVIDRWRTYSYGDLDGLVERTVSGLRQLGFVAGEVLAWQLPNWIESLVIHHAVIRIGGISLPLVPIYRERELRFILRQARARILVTPGRFRSFDYRPMADRLRMELPDLRSVVTVSHVEQVRPGAVAWSSLIAPSATSSDPEDGRASSEVALVLYTSGTTADPKGVLHSHQTLEHENRSIRDLWGISERDCIFMPSPVTHITGLLYGMQLPFMVGASVVLQDVWNPVEARRLVEANAATVLIGATPFVHGLLQPEWNVARDLSSLRLIACGGADVPSELMVRAETELGATACRIYGSTEYPTLTGANELDQPLRRSGTDGRLIGASEARVTDTGDPGIGAAGTSPLGELQVRGPELFVGYVDAALNDQAFDGDGWFKTGDAATLDQDGYVTIVGRIKDIIIRGGENISAREIEDLLSEHPALVDVAVVGLPDPVMGERVCAYVVPAAGRTVTLIELAAFLAERNIARQKLPEHLVIVQELPRTTSGKVQKFRLREDLAHRASGQPTTLKTGAGA